MTDAQNPAGWPDPTRPGVPLNPERDGWHWLESPRQFVRPCLWNPRSKTWLERGSVDDMTRAGWRYLSPCPLPAEVAARVAEARADAFKRGAEAMREACVQFHETRVAASLPRPDAPLSEAKIRAYLQPAWHRTSAQLIAEIPIPEPRHD